MSDDFPPGGADLTMVPDMPTLDELRQYIGPHGSEIKNIWEHFQPIVTTSRVAEFEKMLLSVAFPGRGQNGRDAFYLKPEQLADFNTTSSSGQLQGSLPEFPTHEKLIDYIASQPDGRVQKKKLVRHYKDAVVARNREFVKLVAEVAKPDGDGFIKLKSYYGLKNEEAMLID